MSLAHKYNKSQAEKWCIRLKATHPDGDNYDGVVTHVKPTFIVMREENDFELDGVIILPKRSIRGFRDGKYDACRNRVLRRNGAFRKLRPARWLNSCETIPQVVAAMMRRDVWPGIEIIPNRNGKAAFYIGPVTDVKAEGFSMRCYDAAGKWEAEYNLKYGGIFRIEFDSKYNKHFNEYMRSCSGT